MFRYEEVLQTGVQTLACLAVGYLAAHFKLFEAASTTKTLNQLVMRVCLPALQVWLLAIYTDMRNMQSWRVLGAFMLWTFLIQLGCFLWVLLLEQGKLNRVSVLALVLSANNTGILAPVVLTAALGAQAAPIGMLATVALYFQQLPAAVLLFELHASGRSYCFAEGERVGELKAVEKHGKPASVYVEPQSHVSGQHQPHQEAQQHYCNDIYDPTVTRNAQQAMHQSATSICSLVMNNHLAWSTGTAVVLSLLGSGDYLNPSSKHHIKQLAFIEGTLGWFARCSVPVTLFSTGVWMHGRTLISRQNSQQTCVHLFLKLFVLPWLMLAVINMLGITGDHAVSLVLLSAVPTAQTAFVICEQYSQGTEVVTSVMVVGLLVMLPHIMCVLAVLQWLGVQ